MTQPLQHRPLAEDVPDDALLKVDGATLSSARSARSRV